MFVLVIDTTIMNVSISTLLKDFDTNVATVQAAITLYSLVMASLISPEESLEILLAEKGH